jgi:hypothetical protein
VLTAAFFVLAFGASSAQAAFGIANWESLTCKENVDTPLLGGPPVVGAFPLPQSGEQCLASTPPKWFTQSSGHPNFGITDFTLNNTSGAPDGAVDDIVVETPEGLSVNPEALAQCSLAQAESNILGCPPNTLVGINYLTVVAAPGPTLARKAAPVYNVVPFQGVPSMVAFPNALGQAVYIVGSLDPKDQHVTFTISGTPESPPIVGSRLIFDEGETVLGPGKRFGNGTYLTLPSECAGPQKATLRVTSHAAETAEKTFETPYSATGCDKVPFNPTIGVSVNSAKTDSPDPVTVDIGIPFDPKEPIANSYLKTATVTLPEGAGINPSLANGLQTCTNQQFAYHTNDPIQCPPASEIGTVDVETPSLPPDSLHGKVYVATPESNDPSSGNQFRVFLTVESERYGVNVRLKGNVFPNLNTGRLKVVVDENPQATFSSFKVHINGGEKGALTSPNTCGPNTTTTALAPWTGNADATPSSDFLLTEAPGGGGCPKTLAERPFSPTYAAGTQQSKAGAYSPFELHVTRPDGAQEIRKIEATLPPGMVAKLKGTEYCPQASIDAAGASSGANEIAHPSCPGNSAIGTVNVAVGSGSAPFHTPGTAYLAGPYKGAPISAVFVVPAVAGPYDLGTDVVRTALYINPETAEVHAVSDPIPYIFGGVKLDIRSIDISINRKNFSLNPTTCREAFSVRSSIFGGGGNPADEASWFASSPASPFRATECSKLKFTPKFYARILGGKNQTQRTKNPKFRATLEATKGDANVRRAAFILPRATILDQSHIKTVCTRVQLAANECPQKSIYGNAKATSPLLAGKLKGPVYLTSSDHELPDLLVDLKGQVNIRLRGVISSEHGRLKTVFNNTPDVAVNKFTLTMKGGDRGLLINSRNLCSRQTTTGFLNLLAQNSRRMKTNNLRLNIPACH